MSLLLLANIPMNAQMRPADVDLFLDFEQYQKSTEKKREHQIMIYFFCEIGRKIYIGNRIQS